MKLWERLLHVAGFVAGMICGSGMFGLGVAHGDVNLLVASAMLLVACLGWLRMEAVYSRREFGNICLDAATGMSKWLIELQRAHIETLTKQLADAQNTQVSA